MKQFLLLIAALSGAARLLAAPETPVIAYPEYSVRGTDGGIVIHDYENEPLLKIGTLNFSWAPPIAVPTAIEKNANDSLRISYRIDRDDSGEIKLDGVLKATPDGRIRIDWKLDAPALVRCSNCGAYKRPHRLCTACGHYDGREVVKVEN